MEGTVLHRDFSAEVGREHGRPVGSIEFGRAAPASAVLRGAVEPALPENGLLAVVRSKLHAENHGGRVSLSNQSAPRHRHHERRHHALHQSRHGSLALLYSRNPPFFYYHRLHLSESASNPAGTAGSVEKRVHSAGVSAHGAVPQPDSAEWKPGRRVQWSMMIKNIGMKYVCHTKEELRRCINQHRCTYANPNQNRHVFCHSRIRCRTA